MSFAEIDTVVIENVKPELDGGRYPIKRIVGDLLEVEADIFTHGHDVLRARLQFRKKGENEWRESEMTPLVNDRWKGHVRLEENTTYQYTVFAWRDPFLSWAQDLRKKHEAGQDVTSELLEGKRLVERAVSVAADTDRRRLQEILAAFDQQIRPVTGPEQALTALEQLVERARRGDALDEPAAELRRLLHGLAHVPQLGAPSSDPIREVILGDELRLLLAEYPDRSDCGRYGKVLEVVVDRPRAEFAAWYEMWPRSQGTAPGKSATFTDMERRLDEINRMGFDVVYLTPIHPIGHTNRKGPNNSLICPPGAPGCSYAIGNELGGHTAIEPGLGTLEDFRRFERSCRRLGLEIALDIALQTSPDHPWVKDHPEWFRKRPDGSIKYAENPPKKYEDIYPLDFNTPDREALWREVLGVLRFWMAEGVRIFRVDNPHTKPVRFWEWLIAEVHRSDPDVIFLAEAFTRPKMMKVLAKAGFTQSYTYFTWRNFKRELEEYFTELSQTAVADYLRGNLFCNTPDILPEFLQNAPRSAFKIRATLAATLSSVWGMYNGFELCEGAPLPGKEEYIDSEKYQFKVWDWNRPGNIKDYIARLNRIRREQPALQRFRNLRFYKADNDNILFYGKSLPAERQWLLVVVNLDPFRAQESSVQVPIHELGMRPDETYQLHDLITDKRYFWRGEKNYVRLDPESEVAHVFRLLRWSYREQDFDYFM
jgi:starch synthase (maltosyl-transferring)